MNHRTQKVRIIKPGDYHGRVGAVRFLNSQSNCFVIKLKNKTIEWPVSEQHYLYRLPIKEVRKKP